jgi:hypothetical protein
VSYGWNHDDTGSDFEGAITFNGTLLSDPLGNGFTHVQEPQDSGGGGGPTGTNQQYTWSREFPLDGLGTGTKSILVEYATSSGGAESSIWDILVELVRIN